ncbi:hypothetical protein MN608_11732 [Microdochium nivale]|nr:hypothetical protein MN608_11732 [Microdochium nivale]
MKDIWNAMGAMSAANISQHLSWIQQATDSNSLCYKLIQGAIEVDDATGVKQLLRLWHIRVDDVRFTSKQEKTSSFSAVELAAGLVHGGALKALLGHGNADVNQTGTYLQRASNIHSGGALYWLMHSTQFHSFWKPDACLFEPGWGAVLEVLRILIDAGVDSPPPLRRDEYVEHLNVQCSFNSSRWPPAELRALHDYRKDTSLSWVFEKAIFAMPPMRVARSRLFSYDQRINALDIIRNVNASGPAPLLSVWGIIVLTCSYPLIGFSPLVGLPVYPSTLPLFISQHISQHDSLTLSCHHIRAKMPKFLPNEFNSTRAYPEGFKPSTASFPYASIVDLHVSTRVPDWSFVLFRGAYDNNDVEWDTFVHLLKATVADELRRETLDETLGPTLQWTVIEDRAGLGVAPNDAVRARFHAWVAEQTEVPYLLESIPRFRYCIYVDQATFSTIRAHQLQGPGTKWTFDLSSRLVMVDGTYPHDTNGESDEDNEEDEEDEEDEDIDEADMGWSYIDVCGLVELYALLCHACTDDSLWRKVSCRRRPNLDEEPGFRAQPLSAVAQALA